MVRTTAYGAGVDVRSKLMWEGNEPTNAQHTIHGVVSPAGVC